MTSPTPSDQRGEPRENPYAAPSADVRPAAPPSGLRCPACRHTMGYWTIVASRIPLAMTCPRCHQALYFEGTGVLLGALGLFALGLGLASQRLALAVLGSGEGGAMLVVIFVIVAPIHLALAAYLKRRGTLKLPQLQFRQR
jgi:hypothetical protein